jgi:hypothetical protein
VDTHLNPYPYSFGLLSAAFYPLRHLLYLCMHDHPLGLPAPARRGVQARGIKKERERREYEQLSSCVLCSSVLTEY